MDHQRGDFFKVYRKKIEDKAVSFKIFLINRFTRLYPLHYLTLAGVGILQLIFVSIYKFPFVYQHNDLKHLLLNILFVQNWFSDVYTFNGPSWSVSVEIFVYIAFFFLCFVGGMKNVLRLIAVILLSVIINYYTHSYSMATCFVFFFSGCFLATALHYSKRTIHLCAGLFGIYLVAHYIFSNHFSYTYPAKIFLQITRHIPGILILVLTYLFILYYVILIFSHKFFKKAYPGLTGLGNLTYSMYLIHFPLQIIFFLVLKPTSYTFFNSPAIFLSFMAVTIILGYFVFTFFERPSQISLRKIFLKHQALSA